MNVEEFKKRALRGLIRDKYFYIPVSGGEPVPTQKAVRFVSTYVDWPDLPYERKGQRHDSNYYESYVYSTWSSPRELTVKYPSPPPQGNVVTNTGDDGAYRCGIVSSDDRHSLWYYDKIGVIKVYNGSTYLGYFTYFYADRRQYQYSYQDPENPGPNPINTFFYRLYIYPGIAPTEITIKHYNDGVPVYGTSSYRRNCNLAYYGVTKDYHTIVELDEDFKVLPSSGGNTTKYYMMPSEWEEHERYYGPGSLHYPYTSSNVEYLRADIAYRADSKLYNATDNGIDYQLYLAGQSLREQCQISIPDITTSTVTENTGYRVPIWYGRTSKTAADTLAELPLDLDPDTSFSSGPYLYYGDGMTKEVCSLYQSVLHYDDPSLVGADVISLEHIENH